MKDVKVQDWILLILGIIFIGLTTIFALSFPEPTEFQLWAFRIIASLGAACLGAFIPGLIEIEGNIGEIIFRASGAVALFFTVYLVNPPDMVIQLLSS